MTVRLGSCFVGNPRCIGGVVGGRQSYSHLPKPFNQPPHYPTAPTNRFPQLAGVGASASCDIDEDDYDMDDLMAGIDLDTLEGGGEGETDNATAAPLTKTVSAPTVQ